jgi:hypothetical protein
MPVAVCVHPALWPQDNGWDEALRLRNAARERIGEGCGEPVLPG